MEQTPFALTPEQKGMLASLLHETGQPAPILAAAIAAALEALQDRAGYGGAASPETVPAPDLSKPLWQWAQELADSVPEEVWHAWPHNPEGMDLATADADDPQTHRRLVEELGKRMSRLSEQAYCAGWVSHLEKTLPALCEQAVRTGKLQPFGAAVVCPGMAARFLALRAKIGYWVVPRIAGGYGPYQLKS